MEILKVQALRGPNLWAYFPVLEARVNLGALKDSPSSELPGFNDRLLAWLPTLVEHRCSVGERGGFCQRLRRGTYLAHILEHVTLELQSITGSDVGFGRARETAEEGVYKVVVAYKEEELGRACIEEARLLCLAAVHDQPYDVAATVSRLGELAARIQQDPGSAAITAAARARRIPVFRLGGGLLQLGHGVCQRRFLAGQTDQTGAIAAAVTRDNELTRTLLRAAGVPVPEGRPVDDAEDAWTAAQELDGPVVIERRYGSRKGGPALTTRDDVLAAYLSLAEDTSSILVERLAPGRPWRLAVVGDRVVKATRGTEKGDEAGPDRSPGLHPEVGDRAVDAVRAVGLEMASVDLVAGDIGRPLEEQGGVVTGVVASPDLRQEADGTCVAAEAVLESLFPMPETGRIPVVAVTGVNGKTTTTRLIAEIVGRAHRCVGMACSEGIYVSGRRIETGDCSGPVSARTVLQNPRVDAAVLETARGGILRAGLGFDRCDIAVVTNIADGDHLGVADIDTAEQLARVKRTIVEVVAPTGVAVLKADDPLVADMAKSCAGSVVFFARDRQHPVLVRHRAEKGRVVFVRDNRIVLAEGKQEIPLVPLERVPLTHSGRIGFQVENALAAVAAGWSLGIPCEAILGALEAFTNDLAHTPARFNLLDVKGATVILDYGHNPASLACLIEALENFPHRRRIAVYTAAGDRRDQDLVRQGELLGGAFDRVLLYEEESCVRGRKEGEIIALFRRGLAGGRRVKEIKEVKGALAAVEHSLSAVRPGELLLLQVDLVEETIELVSRCLERNASMREVNLEQALASLRRPAAVEIFETSRSGYRN
jgi:cyanophycin synthetase